MVSIAGTESSLLKFAYLVLIACVNEIRFDKAHQQHETCSQNDSAVTNNNEDATCVDTRKFDKREVERRSSTTRFAQAQQSSDIVLLPSRLDVTELQLGLKLFQ